MTKELIEIIQAEIEEHEKAILKIKSLIPIGILTGIAFGFVFPLLPRRRTEITELVNYPIAVLICLILYGLIYLYGYYTAVGKRKRQIRELEEKMKEIKTNG